MSRDTDFSRDFRSPPERVGTCAPYGLPMCSLGVRPQATRTLNLRYLNDPSSRRKRNFRASIPLKTFVVTFIPKNDDNFPYI